MNEQDKKEFKLMMCEVLEDVVLPEIQSLKDDVHILKEDVKDLKNTTNRIELRLNSVVDRQDEQEVQIAKINKVLKLSH